MRAVREVLDVPGVETVTVDLDDVAYMGAAMLGALVAARKQCRLAGVRLVVACDDPRLRRLFAITDLERSFFAQADRSGLPVSLPVIGRGA